MELSSRVEYALAALLELASRLHQQEPMQIKHIAARQDIPDRYLEHIFHALRRAGLVYSQRGIKGGYLLARKPQQITLLEVFECFESSKGNRPSQTSLSTNRSIVREVWSGADQSAKTVLQTLTLQDLHQQSQEREKTSNMYYI